MKRIVLLIGFIMCSKLYSQCDNNNLADYNNDNILDILDLVVLVEIIMTDSQDNQNSDVNFDGSVDILDVIKLVLKVLNPIPSSSEISYIDYSDNVISIVWDSSPSPLFKEYQILMSNSIDEQVAIDVISNPNQVELQIYDILLYQGALLWVNVVDEWSCGSLSQPAIIDNAEKEYQLDETGHVLFTEFMVDDFPDVQDCEGCHPSHVADWTGSSHAHSMHSPMFFSMWNQEQASHPETGERFCVQCHNPIAFLTGVDLAGNQSLQEFEDSNLPNQVKHGISCTVCHTYTALSPSYFADDNLNASAEYHMYPGENVFFGSIENPIENSYHESQYNPMFSRSEMCLPCHDFTIRGVEAEITFTEWNRIPGLAMSGELSCQECHMPLKADGTHDHSFVGVDVDLTYPLGESPNHSAVQDLLNSAAIISFGAPSYDLPDTISSSESLVVPITIESLTAHNMPSGTGFNREAWVEIVISQNSNIIYESGSLESNSEELDRLDSSLLLFTSYLLDENGDTTYTSSETHDMINETLPGLGFRYHLYNIDIPNDISGIIDIDVSFKFRPFRPLVVQSHIPELLSNLPIFEIGSIHEQIEVVE
ncbi:MAG: hypothetical protein CMG24_01400 [Candidatus Marinimicrobia bacterium]|nr:hypothetical protein [Candidatus Neomarinimicrobiota bacterium]